MSKWPEATEKIEANIFYKQQMETKSFHMLHNKGSQPFNINVVYTNII